MNTPEQTPAKPDNDTWNINHSMLPPERLPAWLREKNPQPARVYNYSMRPPAAQTLASDPASKTRQSFARTTGMQPPSITPAPPPVVAIQPPADETITDRPEISLEIPQDTAVPTIDPPRQQDPPAIEAISEATAPAVSEALPAAEPIIDNVPEHLPETASPSTEEHPEAGFSESMVNTTVAEPVTEPPVSWQTPPPVIAPATTHESAIPRQEQFVTHTPQKNTRSFGDWIANNNQTTTIMVVGVLVFAVVLIVLIIMGIV